MMATVKPDTKLETLAAGMYAAHLSLFPVLYVSASDNTEAVDHAREAVWIQATITVDEGDDGAITASAKATNPELSHYLNTLIRALAGSEAPSPA